MRGPFSTPITPLTGSLFHADPQREYLALLDDGAFNAATPVVPKYLAPTDPASRWTSAHRRPPLYDCSTTYLIDLDHAVIINLQASTAVPQAEVTACKRMTARVQGRFHKAPAAGILVYGLIVCC